MAVTNNPLISGSALFTDTANAGTAVVVKASSAVVYELELDNTANSAASYFKMWNTGAVTVGTTVPDGVLLVPASVKVTIVVPGGWTFGTALTVATTTAGGTTGSTGPTSSFIARLVYV